MAILFYLVPQLRTGGSSLVLFCTFGAALYSVQVSLWFLPSPFNPPRGCRSVEFGVKGVTTNMPENGKPVVLFITIYLMFFFLCGIVSSPLVEVSGLFLFFSLYGVVSSPLVKVSSVYGFARRGYDFGGVGVSLESMGGPTLGQAGSLDPNEFQNTPRTCIVLRSIL